MIYAKDQLRLQWRSDNKYNEIRENNNTDHLETATLISPSAGNDSQTKAARTRSDGEETSETAKTTRIIRSRFQVGSERQQQFLG